MKKLTRKKMIRTAAMVGALSLAAGTAHASTDGSGDFDSFYTEIVGWLQGGLGKTIGVIGLGVGAFQVLRNAYVSAAGFVAIGLLLSLGPNVLDSIMGALV